MRCLFLRCLLLSLLVSVSHFLFAEASPSEGAISWRLYQHAAHSIQKNGVQQSGVPDSLIFCPYSAKRALAMAALGANGKTREQMERILFLPLAEKALQEASRYEKTLFPAFSSYQAIAVQKDFPLLPGYVDAITKNFNAAVFTCDFESDSAGACNQVNSWVKAKTENMIPSLLSSSDIDATTKLLLLNAVHFKKNWRFPFDPKETKEASFYTSNTTTMPVMMMEQTARFLLHQDEQAVSVILEYEVGDDDKARYSCMLVQPVGANELATLEKNLSWEAIEQMRKSARPTLMKLFVPRCTVRAPLSLKEPLMQLGITDAFTTNADFSGMCAAKDIKIDKVIQESVLKIDEAGTEASSATAVIMGLKALAPDPNLLSIRFDRPFFVFLLEDVSGQPLFIGRVVMTQ